MLKSMTIRATLLAVAGAVSMSAHAIADSPKAIDIPAGDLRQALLLVSQQYGADLVYRPEQVDGIRTRGARGELTTEQAVMKLLEGTPLQLHTDKDSGAILISTPAPVSPPSVAEVSQSTDSAGSVPPQEVNRSFWNRLRLAQAEPPENPAGQTGPTAERSREKPESMVLDLVTVTGTRIRGARTSSPVMTITQDEMRQSGQNNLGEVVRALPQSFSGGQNPAVGFGSSAGGLANQNITGASSINLRGLGPDATLVLLNGQRLPYDGFVQATDVLVVPVTAIDRMEVLLDGASAIYGSDAVAGVANIILKRDYQGAELSARYGAATDGGYEQQQYTGLAGHVWNSGGFLVGGDISRSTTIRPGQRDYLEYMSSQHITVVPEINQGGAIFSGHQQLGDSVELSLDAFYTEREMTALGVIPGFATTVNKADPTIFGISPALQFQLGSDWLLRVHGFIGRNEAEVEQAFFGITSGSTLSRSLVCFCNRAEAVGVEADGPVLTLPAGDAQLAVGAGYRNNSFERNDMLSGATTITGSRRSYYTFAEINLPLVSDDWNIPAVTRLNLNGALRYEDYGTADFGAVTTPKVGLTWEVTPDIAIRASWGKSFKAPTLLQQYQARQVFLFPAASLGAVGAPAGSTAMYAAGGNPDLEPERAEVLTAGFVLQPQFLGGLRLELGWFDIDYTDRVVQPLTPLGQALGGSPAFAEFIVLNPSVAQQNAIFTAFGLPIGGFNGNFSGAPYDPSNVIAIANDLFANATAQKATGVDLSATYTIDLFGGNLTATSNSSWLEGGRRITSLSPEVPTAGVLYFPPEFRTHFGLTWSHNGLALSSHVNYVDGVTDNRSAPNVEGDSITTLDLVVDYQMESGPLGRFGLSIAASNVFNERPPFRRPISTIDVNYDTTNYSAIGRVISATVTKRF